jgi:hypothetical protein
VSGLGGRSGSGGSFHCWEPAVAQRATAVFVNDVGTHQSPATTNSLTTLAWCELERARTAPLTVNWNWLLQDDTLGEPRAVVEIVHLPGMNRGRPMRPDVVHKGSRRSLAVRLVPNHGTIRPIRFFRPIRTAFVVDACSLPAKAGRYLIGLSPEGNRSGPAGITAADHESTVPDRPSRNPEHRPPLQRQIRAR